MSMVLPILGWTLFGITILAGLALDLVGLFGNWVLLAAVAGAWLVTGFEHFSLWSVVGITLLALTGEGLEAIASSYGAKRFGGGKGAMLCALAGCLVGAVVGTPLMPIIGTVIGACLGAFLGAASYEFLLAEKAASQALWTGVGAALGRIAGMLAKLMVGVIILGVAALTF